MSRRLPTRVRLVLGAALRRGLRRSRPTQPRSILVVSTQLLGDALFLTSLLAKLRGRYPDAALRMTAAPAAVPLYARRPYGVEVRAFHPKDAATLKGLADWPAADLALVPGDNRNSWLAAALGARWIVAFAGDFPAYKSWPVDQEVPFPERPTAWGDIVPLLVEGPPPPPYRPGDWPMAPCTAFERPPNRYAVLHVEASNPLRHWENEKWLALAVALEKMAITPVWSAGPGGQGLLEKIDPSRKFQALGHKLDLAQLWHLVAGAALLVCPDTSVSHIGKLTFTPTVTLYGPSSAQLFGRGEFWGAAPFREVTIADFPCRDQHTLFKREIEWVRRCQRSLAECAEPRCMQAVGLEPVLAAVSSLGL